MIRMFVIRDAKNKQGFERYCIKQDNGRPYLENAEPIETNDPLEVIEATVRFLKEEE